MAIMALLTGVYHLGRRRAVELLSDIVGVRVSLGALSAVEERVSCAVQPCVDEAWDWVRAAEVKHTDGTSWSQGGVTMALLDRGEPATRAARGRDGATVGADALAAAKRSLDLPQPHP